MLHRAIAAFVVACAAATVVCADDAGKDAKELQGEWQAISLEAQGKKATADEVQKFRILIKGDELAITPLVDGRKARFKLDPGKSPKAIDLTSQDGPAKGKTVKGIYSLENGQLRLCVPNFSGDSGKRPTEFKTQTGDELALLTLERVKPK